MKNLLCGVLLAFGCGGAAVEDTGESQEALNPSGAYCQLSGPQQGKQYTTGKCVKAGFCATPTDTCPVGALSGLGLGGTGYYTLACGKVDSSRPCTF